MTRYSLEIVPKQIERLKILPPKMFKDIYVAFIPGDNISNIIEASKLLKSQGFNPVPHCPARSILDENELDFFLSGLAKEKINKILAIGGSPKNKVGIFDKTLDIFSTGLFEKYNFESINIAGHPEGNPDDKDSEKNLILKCDWLMSKGFNSSIVTQWTLNIDQTNSWVKEIKKNIISKNQGKININLGIAGPAKLTTLINYAKICGVSATSLIIRNKKFGLTKLVKHNPSEIISGLEEYDNLHFFPFGGIKELSEWINNSK
ncbi:MAG: hypothetical protein FI673_01970 [SAR202 cluster bacterium]|jgi:methylenetetrahydrofolate reductase (NADPH)|nr:hypothetical protein [SAR202 cluster bacterium]MQG12321.1 hypothetical protein [SAR202 cluster bacterium]RZP18544.1 MAG: hypothetical protein EVA33_00025 [Chloroflexota bacterium]|tara:strand:- start:25610 stop:26395 length:786 start_codon:yes stop_codon:yes gene_type:complete